MVGTPRRVSSIAWPSMSRRSSSSSLTFAPIIRISIGKRPASWLPRKVGSRRAASAPPSYSGSARNSFASSSVPAVPETTSTIARVNEKSSTLGNLSTRVFTAVCAGSMSLVATSPKMWKFGMPRRLAHDRMAGTNFCQNSGLTCWAVSMRKPSTRYLAIQPQ